MSATVGRCAIPGCFRTAHFGHRYYLHELPEARRTAEYEAARIDVTTDRDRWDVWDGGGLEAPGEDEF